MRAIALAIIMVLLSCWQAVTQTKFGFLGGASTSHVLNSEESLGSRLGGQAGLLFSLGSDRLLSFEGNIYFAMKGSGTAEEAGTNPSQSLLSRRQVGEESDTSVVRIRLDYAEIPLLARVNLFSGAFHVVAGPSVAVQLSCVVTLQSDLKIIPDNDCEKSGKPLIESTDWAAALGFGFDIADFILDVRAIGSLAEITNDAAPFPDRFKNMTYSITGRLPFTIPGTDGN